MNVNKYYVGLDIGTNSVGWCVTDENYKIPKFNGHKMWGARLFDEAETAEARRGFRASRRRLERRKYRLDLLEEIFSEEISLVDPGFFIRLKESKYHFEDRSHSSKSYIFKSTEEEKNFFKKYQTIYHLRAALINGEETGIRELYLAIHHIVKYRGHFLLNGENIDVGGNLKEEIERLVDFLINNLGMSQIIKSDELIIKIEDEVLCKEKSKSDKRKNLLENFPKLYKKSISEIFGLMLGLKCNMEKVLINQVDFEEVDSEVKKIEFNESYEGLIESYENTYGEYFELIKICKSIYDTSMLSKLLIDNKLLSESKVISFEKHKSDLKQLKDILRKNDKQKGLSGKDSLYNKMFRDDIKKGKNYVNYSGHSKIGTGAKKEEFYKYVTDLLKNVEDSPEKEFIIREINLENFLPLQREKINSVIPYQLQLLELNKILNKAEKYHKFLKKETDGISNSDKIASLMKFRIPYYVGPINDTHKKEKGNGFSWAIRKSRERVLPWNFTEVIDVEASAEKFIENLLNKCTYLVGCDVLPRNSILYCEFTLLNELNNIKIDGQRLDYDSKQILFDCFKKEHRKMTINAIKEVLRVNGKISGKEAVTGIDHEIKSDLKSYRDMTRILGKGFDRADVEKIILWITLFNGEKNILESKIRKTFKYISEEQIVQIKKLKYTDWGRLSKEFLLSIKGTALNGKETSIIDAMRYENKNLMELLSNEYDYLEQIKLYNSKYEEADVEIGIEMLDDLYVSPSVKRAMWQTVRISEEIKKIMGKEPEKIFIEMTRTNRAEKNRTTSRKDKLIKLYKNIGKEKELLKKIEGTDSLDFRRKKLYLYYLQKGKCMYSLDTIDLERLFTKEYDIDHIHPRKLKKDDSFDNLVLVKSEENGRKGDKYPISPEIQKNKKEFWQQLKKEGFISDKKYERLIRTTELTDQELSDFISRQLVETSQSTKAVASILSLINKDSKIVYVKAENVTDFRNGRSRKTKKDNQPVEFIKFRELNDIHHAKDAYLNIVVGNVYNEKFTNNPRNYIKENRGKMEYSLNQMFRYEIKRNNYVAWDPKKSMDVVFKMMKSNDVQVTRMAKPKKGELYDATLYKAIEAKKSKDGAYFPIKASDDKLKDVAKYGGYTKIKIAYYAVYKFVLKKEEIIRLIPIPIFMANALQKEKDDYALNYAFKNKKVLEFKMIYPKLYVNSLVKINGFYYYLGGKTDDNIMLKGAVQVILPEEYVIKLKNINSYLVKKKDNPDMIASDYSIYEDVKICDEELEKLYNVLLEKKKMDFFKKKFMNKEDEFEEEKTKEKFRSLDLDEKCNMIMEILNTLTDAKSSYNLKPLGISMYRAKKSMVISKLDEFKVINKSVTGLFSNEVDLLSV